MTDSPFTNIVDDHNKVLFAWATYRNNLSHPPQLITLDHHTDTSRPFRRLIKNIHGKDLSESEFSKIQNSHLEDIDFTKPNTIENAISKLNNDEHIIAAIKSNIISSAFVIAHNAANTDLQTYNEHRIACHTVREMTSSTGTPDYDCVLESSFLQQALAAFQRILDETQDTPLLSKPYILDIDLDYFNTFKSIEPEDASIFKALVKNAGLVTIATEPEYVQSCAIDPGLTSDHLLNKLNDLIN